VRAHQPARRDPPPRDLGGRLPALARPETDLPPDFEARREIHYAAISQPLDPTAFIAKLRADLDQALDRLSGALRQNTAGGVRITTRKGDVWIRVPKLGKQPDPATLAAVKREIIRRWGVVDLLDVLKETDYLTGFTDELTTVATRENLARERVRRRLLLTLFALGTNMGIAKIAAAGEHGESEHTLRRTRQTHINRDNLRRAIIRVVNATLAARDQRWWGDATTVASDSKRFGSWDSNLMTEYHVRYGGPGVMIYWHVERDSACIHSQLTTCSASEVAAMLQGLLHHCTDANIEANYTDTHGASVVAFAFCHLLGFRLLPRLKRIGKATLYRPDDGSSYPGLEQILTRPIRWQLIAQQYDQLVKYATALRLGTAESEQVLPPVHARRAEARHLPGARGARPRCPHDLHRRLPRPTHQLRLEIHEGLQVTEHWNSANGVIFYGKDSELTGADRESQEVSMLALPCSNRRSCTSTRCCSSKSSPNPNGPHASPTPICAPSRRCSGPTSTPTAPSTSTWTRGSTSSSSPRSHSRAGAGYFAPGDSNPRRGPSCRGGR